MSDRFDNRRDQPGDGPAPGGDTLRTSVDQLWKRAVAFFDRGKREVIRTTKIGKVKLDTTLLSVERGKRYQRLGEKAYRLHREGKLNVPELIGLCDEITELQEKIESESKRVDEILKADGGSR